MAEFLTEFITDLASPPQLRTAPHQFAMGDNNAYTFTALVANTAEPEAALLAGTVSGTALRPDGTTVALDGVKGDAVRQVTLSGQTLNATPCSVTLPQACFAYPGRVLISIKLTDGTTATTVLALSGTVIRTETDAAVDPGELIPDLATLQAAAAQALEAAEAATAAADHAVQYDAAQTLTDAQKTTARGNIAAADEAFVGTELLPWDGNGHIANAVTVGSVVTLTVTADNAYRYMIATCTPGERFTINGNIGSAYVLYSFLDADNKLLACDGAGSDRWYYVVTAPAGAAKLLVQCSNTKYGSFGAVYKGVYLPETVTKVASAGGSRTPAIVWLNGGVDSTGFIVHDKNKRSNGLNINPGERLIVDNTRKDIAIAVYASKDGLFQPVGSAGYTYGGGAFVLTDWTFTYYIRLGTYGGGVRPDPAAGGYIHARIEPADVPYNSGYFKWCSYPQIGLHRTYANIKPLLTFERKTITASGIEDSATDCLVSLPNCGWVEVKQDGQSVQFKIAKVTDGVVSFPVADWCYYTHRYWGDGESSYYALVTASPGATAGMDIVKLARLYLGVYTFVDEGATYEHGYSLTGKHLAFIGDSITQGRFDKDGDASHGLETTTSKSFCELVAEISGDDDVGNFGIGGALVANTAGDPWKSLLTNCGKVSGYDTVFICGGTNDYGNNVTAEAFRAAYTTVVETLMANNTEVVCCTPVYRTSKQGANSQSLWLVDYAAIIREIAEAKGIKCIDLLALTSDGCFTRFCPDGLHPNEMGHKVMADWIVREYDRMGLL